MRSRRIKTKPDRPEDKITIGGFLNGKKGTFLWLGEGTRFLGTISGQKLYRLALAIVNSMEDAVRIGDILTCAYCSLRRSADQRTRRPKGKRRGGKSKDV